MKNAKFIVGLVVLVLASCYLPQNPVNLDGNESVKQLSVVTDEVRGQGVYVNEMGVEFDILGQEGDDGEIVKCVEALDIVPVGSGSGMSSKSFGGQGSIKALILGRRHDGYPGVWEVNHDDTIQPVSENESGAKSSKAGESCEVEWMMHGFFGWVYHIASPLLGPDSEGGFIVVGYAENTRGIDFGGNWEIDPGASVAVYWRLEQKGNGHYHLSRARIIGEPNENYKESKKDKDKDFPRYHRYRHSMFVHFLRYLFSSFKFFFLDSFETYLTDVLEAEYDPVEDKYLVKGHVEGEFNTVTPVIKEVKEIAVAEKKNKLIVGLAAIDPYGDIVITVDDGNGGGTGSGGTYERIVIDVHGPAGFGEPEYLNIALYLEEDGVLSEKARDETAVDPGFIEVIDDPEGSGLTAGTYYIEVYHESTPAAFGQAYTVRAISLASGEAVPGTDVPAPLPGYAGDLYETADETYSNTTAVVELDTTWIQRYLTAGSDVDWIRLVLPELP